jgi:hypothetical protein
MPATAGVDIKSKAPALESQGLFCVNALPPTMHTSRICPQALHKSGVTEGEHSHHKQAPCFIAEMLSPVTVATEVSEAWLCSVACGWTRAERVY